MSKKGTHLEYVKPMPDFLAKMGLSKAQVQEHQSKNQEAKLEDKFVKKTVTAQDLEEDKKLEYDFENAQIDDLANML